MNGRQKNNATQNPAQRRLLAALALSVLLHALAILAPFLGASRPPYRGHSAWLGSWTTRLEVAFLPSGTARPLAIAGGVSASVPDKPANAASSAAEGTNVLPLRGIDYFPAEGLTRRPQPEAAIELDTPEIRSLPGSGRMVLTLWIDFAGAVRRVDTVSSELPDAFAKAATTAFSRARFIPGEIDGRAVGSIVRLEVTYEDPRLVTPALRRPQTP